MSRAGIHKALREGRLTAFTFQVLKKSRGLLGVRTKRTTPYIYIPISECKAWWQALNDRALRLQAEEVGSGTKPDADVIERVSQRIHREVEGEKPDYDARFLDQPKKKKRK